MQPIEVRNGDDMPVIYVRLRDGESRLPIDLSAASTVITAKFRAKGTTTVLATITCGKPFGGTSGWTSITPAGTTLDVTRGRYEIEVSVDFNGTVQTVRRFYWLNGLAIDDAKTIPVKVYDDF